MRNRKVNYSSVLPIDSVNLLVKCNQEMFSTLDLDKVYHAIVNSSFAIVPDTEICLLLSANHENQKLKVVKKMGIDLQNTHNLEIEMGEGITGEVAQSGLKKIIYDVDQCVDLISQEIKSEKNIGTFISLPLKVVGNVMSVLNLYLPRSSYLSLNEEAMLDIFSGHAAIAIQNANIYNSMKHTLDDMDSISQIAKSIASTLEFNSVLDRILSAAQQIVNTNIAFLWYKDLMTNEWKSKFPTNLTTSDLKLPNIERGEGIIGHVLKTGKPYLCPDTTRDIHYFPSWEETKSELTIPLIIDNEVKGILDVESTKFDAFSEGHSRLLTMLAEEAAIAFRNAQLYEIADQKTRQFITLREIGEALSQQKGLNEILEIIARESLNMVGHGNKVASVMLVDKEKKMLETKASCGELCSNEYLTFHIPLLDRSIVTCVVRTGKLRIIPDVRYNQEYYEISSLVKSEIAVPLFFRNEVIGVIDIESSELNAFDEKDQALLQTLADNAAAATKIGELCDIRLRQLETLYNIGNKISSSLKLSEVLNSIASEGFSAIGSTKRTIYVQLLDEDKGLLEIKDAAGINSELYIGRIFQKDEGISGKVVKTKKYCRCPDVKKDNIYIEIDANIKSELCVPIVFNEQVIGLINVESIEKDDFGQPEVYLLQQLANQAGVAIENARLNEELADTQFQLTEALGVTVVSEALSGLTHDIRTALSLISGEAQWIEYLHENKKLQLEEVIESMEKIESQVARIETMTNDLMERAQDSRPDFVKAKLSDIIRSSVQLTSGYARRQRVEIDVHYSTLLFMTQVDIGRLKCVFINLIKNAIEALPDGGKICIWAKNFPEYFDIFFSDTGEGIGKEDMKKIWKPFFSLKIGGSGLGLPNCKRIIEMDHGGKINIKSSKGKGTTFRIRLPYEQE